MNHLYVNQKKAVKQKQFRASKNASKTVFVFRFFLCAPGSRSWGWELWWTLVGMSKTMVNNGIKYQPQLVSWISAINIMQPSVWCIFYFSPVSWLSFHWQFVDETLDWFSWQNPSGCCVMIQLDSSKSELPDATEVKTDRPMLLVRCILRRWDSCCNKKTAAWSWEMRSCQSFSHEQVGVSFDMLPLYISVFDQRQEISNCEFLMNMLFASQNNDIFCWIHKKELFFPSWLIPHCIGPV